MHIVTLQAGVEAGIKKRSIRSSNFAAKIVA